MNRDSMVGKYYSLAALIIFPVLTVVLIVHAEKIGVTETFETTGDVRTYKETLLISGKVSAKISYHFGMRKFWVDCEAGCMMN